VKYYFTYVIIALLLSLGIVCFAKLVAVCLDKDCIQVGMHFEMCANGCDLNDPFSNEKKDTVTIVAVKGDYVQYIRNGHNEHTNIPYFKQVSRPINE